MLQKGFGELGSSLATLNGVERLRILHDFYRMGEEEYFSFDFEEAVRVSRDYKDDICNSMLKFYPTYMQDEKRFAKALFIKKYPSSLSDRFLTELATVPAHPPYQNTDTLKLPGNGSHKGTEKAGYEQLSLSFDGGYAVYGCGRAL